MESRWLGWGLLVISIVAVGGYVQQQSSAPVVQPSVTSSPVPSNTFPPTTSLYYPITNYAQRLTTRRYGQLVTAADQKTIPCGAAFTGLHDGDDLEVTSAELNQDVPVYAIADGTVRQVGHANGYGGLLIIQHTLNNQTVTANYGHIDLSRTTVKAGDHVTAGHIVSYLGQACSSQTDGERKHLHFALHQGSAIDIKGYVQSSSELRVWLNPQQVLSNLHAQNP